jgi:hypothetical protein
VPRRGDEREPRAGDRIAHLVSDRQR